MKLNYFLRPAMVALLLSPFVLLAESTVKLEEATILELNQAFENGTLTSEDLVKLYLKRIEAYDDQGPKLNAVLKINDNVMEIARQLDEERRISGPRSILHGIPIVLKDNFDTNDMPTTGGSLLFKDNIPEYDAFVVEKLRREGAIIFAKVNMSGFMGTRLGTGDSAVGGQTLNPYNLLHHPGGSSGATGVSVAAWFATAGLGTETGVSIRDPSANNAVVGIAPTEGLVSRTGVLPISFVHDRSGPMARSVTDAAAVLTVIAGIDAADLYTLESAGKIPKQGYTAFLDKDGLKGARIGVLIDLFNEGPEYEESLAIIATALEDLSDNGAYLIQPLSLGVNLRSILRWSRSSSIENKFALDVYFRGRGPNSPVKSFEEYVQTESYYPRSKENLMRSLAIESLDTHDEFASLMVNRRNLRDLTEKLMDEYQLDALVYPMKTFPAAEIPVGESRGELRPRDADNPFSSITGLPAIVVPAGFDSDGLPVALEFLGRRFSEPTLIRLAYAYEQATKHRHSPVSTPALPGEVISLK
jgi:Asp-tRNA(Asn)/Glu-tRNA(Gln) amidotransferase A subunit family amidase